MDIKTIGDLKDLRFFVPAYQRGYRWTENEVEALLDDIYEFSTEGQKKYCIQPLIVKRREDDSFEVVDGQQRLTTIFIFMKIAEEKTEYIPFELEFETRKNSQEFLSKLLCFRPPFLTLPCSWTNYRSNSFCSRFLSMLQ